MALEIKPMPDRFFVHQPIESQQVEVGGIEAHHLIHVMRAKVEHEVTLFDGSGSEYLARLTSVGRTAVQVEIIEQKEINRELDFELTIGVALPKGDRQKWLIEKAVELGVTRIVPLRAERSVAVAGASALVRLRRVVIEASKQCGRNRLLQIDEAVTTAAFLEESPREARRLFADPNGELLSTQSKHGQATLVAIGPEGGFTGDEIHLAENTSWELVSLGPRILRTETAAIAVASGVVWSDIS
jgi:16S rRNA (uracil1498-N3)-methyltransferase